MSDDIITLFSVNIECTEAQAKVLTDKLDSLDDDFENPGWAGHLEHRYQGGELVIESYETGQPHELGELIAKWQTDTGHDKPVSFVFAGQQGCIVWDVGRVDVHNGKLLWNYIDLREIKVPSVG